MQLHERRQRLAMVSATRTRPLGLSVTRSAILGGTFAGRLVGSFLGHDFRLVPAALQFGNQAPALRLERGNEPSRPCFGGPCRGGARVFDDSCDRSFELHRDLGGLGIARQVGDTLARVLFRQRHRQVDLVIILGPALGLMARNDLHILPGLFRQSSAARQPVGDAACARIVGGGGKAEIAEILYVLLQEAR